MLMLLVVLHMPIRESLRPLELDPYHRDAYVARGAAYANQGKLATTGARSVSQGCLCCSWCCICQSGKACDHWSSIRITGMLMLLVVLHMPIRESLRPLELD